MDNTNNFVNFHVSCCACGSSDARCINKDGSYYCLSCETYFKAPSDFNLEDLDNIEGDTMTIQAVQRQPTVIENVGTFSAIKDRAILLDTTKKYGVKVVNNGMGQTDKHIYPYYDTKGSLIATKTRYVKNKQFSITGSTSDSGLFGQQLFNGGKYVTITEGEI